MSLEYPTNVTTGDVVHAVGKGASALLEGISGATVAELLDLILAPPLTRRRDAFFIELNNRVKALENEGINLAQLSSNEQFVSAVLQATTTALKTHLEDKRRALLNAVANVARRSSIDDTVQAMFFNFLDTLRPDHLILLKLFATPAVSVKGPQGDHLNWSEVVEKKLPHLRGGDLDLWMPLLSDLQAKGLVYTSDIGAAPAGPIASGLGQLFLEFVSDSSH